MHPQGLTGPDRPPARAFATLLSAACCYALVACALLWPSLIGDKRLTSVDALGQFEPWRSAMPADFEPANPLLLDQSIAFLPWMDFAADELRRGELPLWNPYNFCGHPFVGTYQSALYWPLNWLHYAWPGWQTHAWTALLRLVLAGTFTFLFLRLLGLSAPACALGGLGFMLSGFMVAWLNHPHSNAALLLPALWSAVERMVRKPGARAASLFGLFVGLELLAGHVQTALHVALLTGLYVAARMFIRFEGRRLASSGLAWLMAGATLGGLLAAPQLLPFLEYLNASQAAIIFDELDTVDRPGLLHTAKLLLFPDAFGGPHTGDYTGPLGPNLNYNELIGGHVGKVVLLAAIFALVAAVRSSRRRAPILLFAGVVVLCALVSYQVYPFYDALQLIPKLRSTKLLRFSLFVALGLATLGAFGLNAVLERIPRRARLFGFSAFALCAVELLSVARGYNPQIDPELILPDNSVTSFLQAQDPSARVLGIDNSIYAPNANLFHRVPMIGGYDSIEYRSLTELCLAMTETPPEYPFITKIGLFDRLDSLPLISLLGARFLLSPGPLPRPEAMGLTERLSAETVIYENDGALPRAFLARDVQVVSDAQERVRILSSPDFDPWTALIEAESAEYARFRDSAANASAAPDSVLLAQHDARTVEVLVRTGTTSLLVLTDSWDPGWSATVTAEDAEEARPEPRAIERTDHHFRGVWVEPGHWRVRFRYDPASSRIGWWAMGLAALGLGLLARVRPRALA